MPLSLLVAIVAVGVAAVIGIVHYSGGARAGRLDEDIIRNIWENEFSGSGIICIFISDDQRTAIIELSDNEALGLVRQMGAHHIARKLEPGSLQWVDTGESVLKLSFREITMPRITYPVNDDGQYAELAELLGVLIPDKIDKDEPHA